MSNKLSIVNVEVLSPQTIAEIDKQVGNFIERHRNNRQEISRLVFDGTAALTVSDKLAQNMNSQGTLKRFWKRFTGVNSQTQKEINVDLLKAQYAAQQTLQKLAEQNLLNTEMIVAINNRLNASMVEVNAEINKIYDAILKFFSKASEQLKNHEERIKQLEHKDKLQHWAFNIRNKIFEGVKYKNLDDATKIVCLVRDFFELTGGKILVDDLIYLETAMENVGIQSDAEISGQIFIQEVGRSTKLYNHLLGGDSRLDEFATEYEPIILSLREVKESADRNFFVVQESAPPAQKSLKKAVNPLTVGNYELAVELLYNLKQVNYTEEFYDKKKRAEKLFLNCKIDEALPLLEETAAAGDIRSRYILAIIYNEGINVEQNSDYARELLAANVNEGDACSTIYGIFRTSLLESNNSKGFKATCKKIENTSDIFEQYELTAILDDKKALIELKRIAAEGYFLACHELGCKYYYGRDGVAEDNETARKYFKLSADMGYGKSMLNLGEIYYCGFGVSVDKKRGVEWYRKAYEKFSYSETALVRISAFYSDQENYSEAFTWHLRGVERDYTDCIYLAALYYFHGKGVDKNYAKAAEYFKRNVKNGKSTDGDLEDYLGDIYWEGGYGVSADRLQAVTWYEMAYEKGTSSDGLLARVGKYYDDQKNYSEAIKWWRLGEEKDYSTCIYLLGCSYLNGEGFSKDYSKAAKYFKRAIELGFNNGGAVEDLLGNIYWDGGYGLSVDKNQSVAYYKKAYEKGTSSDGLLARIGQYYQTAEYYTDALKWYRRGAEKNYTYCLLMVAAFYRYGLGVGKDYSEAVRYCNRAVNSAEANGYSKSEITKTCNNIKERGFFESFFD